METIIEKLEKREKLNDADINTIIETQTIQIDNLRKENLKSANRKSNEAISRTLLANYNYKIECLEASLKANVAVDAHKLSVENAANNILKKMEWWK